MVHFSAEQPLVETVFPGDKPATKAVLAAGEQLLTAPGLLIGSAFSFTVNGQSYRLIVRDKIDEQCWSAILAVQCPAQITQLPPADGPWYTEFATSDIALRRYEFQPNTVKLGQMRVLGASATRVGYEGQGWGMGLGLLSNLLLERLIADGRFKGFTELRAEIADAAVGQGPHVDRTGWSSILAQRLGYQKNPPKPLERPFFTKIFPV